METSKSFVKCFFFLLPIPCGMWDLSSPTRDGPGIKPMPPAVEAQSLNHWNTRESDL